MAKGKGDSTQTTTSTYSPDPEARGYISDALGRARSAANLGFNIPVAPVAGFSNDQQRAFNTVNNAQGMAQPFYGQAANLYNQGATGSNISNFFNPYADAVGANLKDIFGSQMSQTTGQLQQAAGGIGADRIAVGQSELAKQQGLAAGQTFASLYQPALQASQNAAFNGAQGLMGVGQGMQNSALQGAQAQLGTGGLQQQLQQAQMNAPYQNQVAQAAFPYQQAQFYSGQVGALAPGLGGTTSGVSTNSPAQPSIGSQILGGGLAAAGGLGAITPGGLSAYNPFGTASYGGGSVWDGSAYGGSSQNPLPGLSASDYGYGYADGGCVGDPSMGGGGYGKGSGFPMIGGSGGSPGNGYNSANMPALPAILSQLLGFLSSGGFKGGGGGGYGKGAGASPPPATPPPTNPAAVSAASSPTTPTGGNGKGSAMTGFQYADGGGVDDGWKEFDETMQGLKRYTEGGGVDDDPIDVSKGFIPQSQLTPIKPNIPQVHFSQPSGGSGKGAGDIIGSVAKVLPFFLAQGGAVNPFAAGQGFADGGFADDPFGDDNRLAGYELLRQGMGTRAPDSIPGGEPAPEPIRLAGPEAMQAWRDGVDNPSAMAMAEESPAATSSLRRESAETPQPAMAGAAPAAPAAMGFAPEQPQRGGRFIDSPGAALMAAGLGIMGGTSPFAGVNIGQGGMQGLKTLQQQRENELKDFNVDLEAKKLAQEAQQHLLTQTQMTPYQKESIRLREKEMDSETKNSFTYLGPAADGSGSVFYDKRTGQTRVDPTTVAGKAKPLPSSLQKDLGEKATAFNQLSSLQAGFKPDYAGYGSAMVGDVANWAARQYNVGNTNAADWWQTYQAYKNEVRHKLFGAALTATETAQWERQDVNPGMAPERIQANIERQKSIVEGALRRRASALVKQGYPADVIEAEIGFKPGASAAPSGGAPQVGSRKQFKQGWGIWNGQTYVPEGAQ